MRDKRSKGVEESDGDQEFRGVGKEKIIREIGTAKNSRKTRSES